MTIADMSLITAEVKVDETDVINLALHQTAQVKIDAIQDDPRLRSDYPQPTPLDQLPDLRFSVDFLSGGGVLSRGLHARWTGGRRQPLAGKCACDGERRSDQVYGLETVSLRYFNVFGPRQKDSPYSGVIAIFLAKILKGENPTIFGDGKQSRDFTYIDNVVQANLLAMSQNHSLAR
jgi:hypothetical protein